MSRSMPPSRPIRLSRCGILPGPVTSKHSVMICAGNSSSSWRRASHLRPVMPTRWPACAYMVARARPIPELAPMMITFLTEDVICEGKLLTGVCEFVKLAEHSADAFCHDAIGGGKRLFEKQVAELF